LDEQKLKRSLAALQKMKQMKEENREQDGKDLAELDSLIDSF